MKPVSQSVRLSKSSQVSQAVGQSHSSQVSQAVRLSQSSQISQAVRQSQPTHLRQALRQSQSIQVQPVTSHTETGCQVEPRQDVRRSGSQESGESQPRGPRGIHCKGVLTATCRSHPLAALGPCEGISPCFSIPGVRTAKAKTNKAACGLRWARNVASSRHTPCNKDTGSVEAKKLGVGTW